MKVTRYAWAAGFFDGEGTISLRGSCVSLRVPQKDDTPLVQMVEYFGGKIYHSQRVLASGAPTHIGLWQLNGRPAVQALRKMLPYLTVKRQRAKEAIECSKHRSTRRVREDQGRYDRIKQLRVDGLTFQAIANELGISKQRVHAIYRS